VTSIATALTPTADALIASRFTPRAALVVDEDRSCHDRGHGFGFSLYNIPFITYLYIIQQVYTPGNPCLTHPVIPPDTSQSASVDYRLSICIAIAPTHSRRPAYD